MNQYEQHLLDKVNELMTYYETKIESLYYQLSLEQQENAVKEIMNRKLMVDNRQLLQENDEINKKEKEVQALHNQKVIK